jgi:hypothetical protein
MNPDIELMDSVSYFLFTVILYFLSVLSKRLGDVMRMKKYYYLYYAGMFFTLLSSLASIASNELEYSIFFKYATLAIGLTLGLIATIKYWGWLIKELIKG